MAQADAIRSFLDVIDRPEFAEFKGHFAKGDRAKAVDALVGAVLSLLAQSPAVGLLGAEASRRLRANATAATDRLLEAYAAGEEERRSATQRDEFISTLEAELQPWFVGAASQAAALREDVLRTELKVEGNALLLSRLVETIAEDKGVPVAALRTVLSRLGEVDVPVDAIPALLSRKADELLALRAQLRRTDSLTARDAALARLESGDVQGARAALRGAYEAVRAERTERSGAEAMLLAEEAALDDIELRYRDAADKYDECVSLVAYDPGKCALYLLGKAICLLHQGDEFGDAAALFDSIATSRMIVKRYALDCSPGVLAEIRNNLGIALTLAGTRRYDRDLCEQAIEEHRRAMDLFRQERRLDQWASAQNNLGNALLALGQLDGDVRTLRAAETAYRATLLERSPDRSPLDWAQTQDNLGIALFLIGKRELESDCLHAAIAVQRAALRETVRERAPLQWARAQHNLAAALTEVGCREAGGESLSQALEACHAALLERTRFRVPLKWAATQGTLGSALKEIGLRNHSAETLAEAVNAHLAALSEERRDSEPLLWAGSQHALGETLWALGIVQGDVESLHRAEAALRSAQEVWARDVFPFYWAEVQILLGNVITIIAAREDATRYAEAAEVLRESLRDLTPEGMPSAWSIAHNDLGRVLVARGAREGNPELFYEALKAHEAALDAVKEDRAPSQWATTWHAIGYAASELGAYRKDVEILGKALAAFRKALQVRTPETSVIPWSATQFCMITTYVRLACLGFSEALDAAEAALGSTVQRLEASLGTDHPIASRARASMLQSLPGWAELRNAITKGSSGA